MGLETQSPGWEWFYIALYFYIGGVSAGAFFIGSLAELLGGEKHRPISAIAYLVSFPLILVTPLLLIADLGQPLRFWHLFLYRGIPYVNMLSPLSVGSWALLVFAAFSLLAFLDTLVASGRLKAAPFARLYNRVPRKVFAVIGSVMGFFVAGYTGVLLNMTARPLWAATDPWLGVLFIASAGSTGAALIVLVMVAQRKLASEAYAPLEHFDRAAMIAELVLIGVMLVLAGSAAAPLIRGPYAALFWVGVVALGVLAPLALNGYAQLRPAGRAGIVTVAAVLALLGGAVLRISLVVAGQV